MSFTWELDFFIGLMLYFYPSVLWVFKQFVMRGGMKDTGFGIDEINIRINDQL